ncbi:hypothetical protein [Kiritimatiella glycovorans]|uniref:Uncharacterized protein n=1 Tax=Kiritimatiella glycovorans TaxID=1307763 RepID=A0A0G3EH51_9BACT|nr:hypothetical protein [Kiritimatiella glycovorans]AKJ63464.1 hypothetical protein L21SP4_00180 [Kiritimatiella glycovorans]
MTETEVKTVQRKRQGAFMSTIGPVTKIFVPLVAALAMILILALALEIPAAMGATAIALLLTALLWVGFGFASSARARGARTPAAWGLGAVFGLLLAPLGMIVFLVLWNARVGGGRCGFCPGCNRRIGFEVPACPYCGCAFSQA